MSVPDRLARVVQASRFTTAVLVVIIVLRAALDELEAELAAGQREK
jgi:hypothetical protein